MSVRLTLGLLCLLGVFFHGKANAEPVLKDNIAISAKGVGTTTWPLRSFLTDPNTPGPLLWKITAAQGEPLPSWLALDTVSPNENLVATNPTSTGTVHFMLFVTKDQISGSTQQITLTVLAPPLWKDNPVILPNAKAKTQFSFDLLTEVSVPSGQNPPTFTATGLPGWMKLNGSILSGTPQDSDVGDYSGIGLVAHGDGGDASDTAKGTVLPDIIKPHWIATQNILPDAHEDVPWSNDLKPYLTNPSNWTLTYQIVNEIPPPQWVQVGPNDGQLFGTAGAESAGKTMNISVQFTATLQGQQQYQETSVFTFNVIHTPHPPKWATVTIGPVTTGVPLSQNLTGSVSNPDGGPLTFSVVSYSGGNPQWADFPDKTKGVFSGTAQSPNVGTDTFVLKVTNNEGLSDTTTVAIQVIQAILPPKWSAHPLQLKDAQEGVKYSVDLTSYASDPNTPPKPLFFTPGTLPSGMTITSGGILQWVPASNEVGLNSFQVTVSNHVASPDDTTTIQIMVAHVNHPPVWDMNPITTSVPEDQAMSFSIAAYAHDPDTAQFGDTISFQVVEGPSWATLSPQGTFTGSPTVKQEGANTFTVRVTDNHGASAAPDATVTINVLHHNHPPYWTKNPIVLPNTPELSVWTASVAQYAKDDDPQPPEKITCSKVGNDPAWVTVNADCSLTGTPPDSAVGANSINVRVTDTSLASADTVVQVAVDSVAVLKWKNDPIQMDSAYTYMQYQFDLTPYVYVKNDTKTLHYSLTAMTGPGVTGPQDSWMKVSDAGQVTGQPTFANVGDFTGTVQVTDGTLNATTHFTVTVVKHDPGPQIDPIPPLEVKERQTGTLDLTKYVHDQDPKATLTYTLVGENGTVPTWLTLSSAGLVSASPQYTEIGTHTMDFSVNNGTSIVYGKFQVIVDRDDKIVWLNDPITMTAETGTPFNGTLNGLAKDFDNLPLQFKRDGSGPAWLQVASDGTLSGTPTDADVGQDTFKVTAYDQYTSQGATLIITVKLSTQTDVTQVDTPVDGALAENLWVIDNSKECDKTIKQLRKNIGVFYDDLAAAKIHFTSVFLSGDPKKFKGQPIPDNGGNLLIKWDNINLVGDFSDRLDNAYSGDDCGNCNNSPLWAMFLFYGLVPQESFYHNSYMMPLIPMDALIVSHQRDHYKHFAEGTAQDGWGPEEYAKDFMDFHANEKKAYRVSAIAPECPKLIENSPDHPGDENAYRVVQTTTGGQYWATKCDLAEIEYSEVVKKALHEYAEMIKFRAFVEMKKSIPLSKKPLSVNTIKVKIGGVDIPGGTGSSTDEWTYDPNASANGSVLLRWDLIDKGQLKPGDTISITYRVG